VQFYLNLKDESNYLFFFSSFLNSNYLCNQNKNIFYSKACDCESD
jgi:hypothetical protein